MTTARVDGKLVGYYINIAANHLHYRTTLFGHGDMYYIAPPYRQGTAFLRLLLGMEKAMRDLGMKKLTGTTKLSKDMSAIFIKAGWKPQELVLTKVLE